MGNCYSVHSDGSVQGRKERQRIELTGSDGGGEVAEESMNAAESDSKEKQMIQLVHTDGSVEKIVDESMDAGKIMESFPQHMVCSSDSFYIGQKIPALAHNEKLKMGHMYFLLPKKSFQSVLSLVSLPSLLSPLFTASSFPTGRKKGNSFVKPFEIEKVGGGPRMRICAEFLVMIMEEGKLRAQEQENIIRQKLKSPQEQKEQVDVTDRRLCNTARLQMEYAQLVKSRKQGWKPKLETIQEKGNGWRFNINKVTRNLA